MGSEYKVGLGPCWTQKRHPRSKAHSRQSASSVAAARSGPASTLPALWPGSAPLQAWPLQVRVQGPRPAGTSDREPSPAASGQQEHAVSDSASHSLWERALPCLLPSWRSQCSRPERGCAAARKRASSTLRDQTGRGVCSGRPTPSLLSQLKKSPRCLRGPVPPCWTPPRLQGAPATTWPGGEGATPEAPL